MRNQTPAAARSSGGFSTIVSSERKRRAGESAKRMQSFVYARTNLPHVRTFAEQAFVLLVAKAVGHPSDIVANGELNTHRCGSRLKRNRHEFRSSHESFEHRSKAILTAAANSNQIGVAIDMLIKKFLPHN